jgi:hypothetical protein
MPWTQNLVTLMRYRAVFRVAGVDVESTMGLRTRPPLADPTLAPTTFRYGGGLYSGYLHYTRDGAERSI